MQIKLILWDWFQTLSARHLYDDLLKDEPKIYEELGQFISENQNLVHEWLSGDLGYQFLHEKFAEVTGKNDTQIFDKSLRVISESFDVSSELVALIKDFKKKGIDNIIIADNQEAWDEFFLPQYSSYYSELFADTYVYAEEKTLQEFVNGIFKSRSLSPDEVLLVDDDMEIGRKLSSDLGIQCFQYSVSDPVDELRKYATKRG